MKNILYIIPSALGNGGIEKMVISWISGMNKDEYHFDCVFQKVESQERLKDLKDLGCEVYEMPYRYRHLKKRRDFFNKIMDRKKYYAVHVHTTCAIDCQALQAAKAYGVPLRIAHSHSSSLGNSQFLLNTLHKLCRPLIARYATHCLACSTMAGEHMYGKRVTHNSPKFAIIRNGIDIQKYKYDAAAREKAREKLGIASNQILLGFIARYDPLKRHGFAVDVLRECCDEEPGKYRLLLIGSGGTKASVEKKVEECGLNREVVFIDQTFNVPQYLSAMDVMVFPSRNEGLSVVLVEAQCNGLPCITTDQISKETWLTDDFTMMPIESSARDWKEVIQKITNSHSYSRNEAYKTIQQKKYDIASSVSQLQEIYSSAGD